MINKLEKELISLDKKRLDIRNKYKNKLINYKKRINKKDYIFFPKSVVSENNYQLRYGLSWLQNGFVIKKGNNVIVVDPGVDFVLRLTESGFDLSSITHIFISHAHLDHAAGANTLMDFMIRARSAVKIIAPQDVYDRKAISDFHSGIKPEFPVNHSAIIIDEKSELDLFDGYKMTFVALVHGVPCYGFKISGNNETYTHLSDTSYTKELIDTAGTKFSIKEINKYALNASSIDSHEHIKNFVKGSDVLITNIDSFIYTKNSKTHLPLLDLIEIVKESNIKKIILAHINPIGELKYEEWGSKMAKFVTKKSGIKTITIKSSCNRFII